MDNSQSSDIFSETSVQFRDISTIDIESYEALLLKIKRDANYQIVEKSLNNFSSFLDDCSNCVFQGFNIIAYLLEESVLSPTKLRLYLEETVYILQVTSNLVKTIIETVAVTCCTMRTFSTTTGNIILSVFSHCKESECIYGSHIRMFEKQLKDLFRNCHELQLTYLMALEKHFIFDMTEKEEQDIFMETLNINLRIGELVQALDVKTMAEQWKAYTMICEKYSNFLSDGDIFSKTTKVLGDIVRNNINTAIEVGEDKVVIRSLKVASFSLKIVLRIIKIFKNMSSYEHIVEILEEILLYNSNYYEIKNNIKSEILITINTHLSTPYEAIISSLVIEESFIKYVNSIKFNNSEDLRILRYVLLIISIMKATFGQDTNEVGLNIVKIIVSILPKCHKYLNMGLKFSYKNDKIHGLFEHLLFNSLSTLSLLNSQSYLQLEKILFEAILRTDCVSALFCSNLWVLLCRSGSSQLQINSLVGLIQIYQKLEENKLFPLSPHYINLTHTIENLFKILQYPEKLQVYKQFSIYDQKNYDFWCVLKIRNLPENLQMSARKVVTQKISNMAELNNDNFQNEQVKEMIKLVNLASTCDFLESDKRIEQVLVIGWCKVCPKSNDIRLEKELDAGSILYFRFLTALVSLTKAYYERIADRSNLVKIVHVISDLLILGNIETVIVLFRLFCHMIVSQGKCQNVTVFQTLKCLLESNDVEKYIYSVIISNEKFDKFFTHLFHKEKDVQIFDNYKKYKSILHTNEKWQKKLQMVSEFKYTHKCVQISSNEPKLSKQLSNECNFDSDFDMFDIENDHQVNKKPKIDTNIDNILEKLESEVSKLCQVKENILNEQYKTRIRKICEKLGSLT